MADMPGMDHAAMGAMTGNADQDFLRMMSDHHKGLVSIAQAAKDNATAAEGVRADARRLDAAQTAQISAMVTMLDTAFKDTYQPTVSPDNKAMADALAAQSGEAYNRLFYETMVKHHQQAIAMVDDHLSKLARPTVQAMAAQMKADQSRELSSFGGKPGDDALKEAGSAIIQTTGGVLQSHAPQQLCIDRDDDRTERHQHRAHRRREDDPPRREHAGRKRNGHDVVTSCPPEILHHFSIRRA
jgi:uncharacterized protein (DUF305 family)